MNSFEGWKPPPPTMTMLDVPMAHFNGTLGAWKAPAPILISHVGRRTTAAPTKTHANGQLQPQGRQIDHVDFNLNDENVVQLNNEPHRDLLTWEMCRVDGLSS